MQLPKYMVSVLLLNSFRYCLGRSTYAVSECVEHLQTYWYILSPEWQKQIHRDIIKAISVNHADMEMDIEQWEKILELPIKELNKCKRK